MLEFYNSTHPKARKQHKCDLCGKIININEKYHRYSGKYDGDMFDDCYCLICENLISEFCDKSNDSDYNADWISDWLHDEYCLNCDKHETCNISNLSCELIRKNYI